MDTFSSNGVGSIETVKRAIVPTRVTHSRNSSNRSAQPWISAAPSFCKSLAGERFSPWVTQWAEEFAEIQTKYRKNSYFYP